MLNQNQNFEFNLCQALAHTLVLEQALPGVPAGYFRNDFSTSAPDPAAVSEKTLLAQMEAISGTGKFASVGPLPDLIKKWSPTYTSIALDNANAYLNGTANSPGLMALYKDVITPALSDVQSQQRAADIADVKRLGPEALATQRAFNPQVTQTLDTLNSQATQELQANGNLDPFTKTMLQQNIRSAQTARGVGTGYGDAAAEGFYEDATRQQRRDQAQQFAEKTMALTAGYYQDPWTQVLNRSNPNATLAAAAQGVSGSQTATSPVYSAFTTPSSSSMFNSVYGAEANANNMNAQMSNNLFGGLIGGGLGLFGSAFSAAGKAGGFGNLFS